jgi:guanine deaminase
MAIQTHISENLKEIDFTMELFNNIPGNNYVYKHYADVYDHHGLIREGTILGHACHLKEDEINVIKSRKAGIAHCPTSNFNIRSGLTNVGKLLDRGIKVGLGTDCSGGYTPSIVKTIQDACVTSKLITLPSYAPPADVTTTDTDTFTNTEVKSNLEGKHLPIATLLYLATLGGAEVCCLDKVVGNFEVGKEFDAIVVSVPGQGGAKAKTGGDGRMLVEGGGNPAVWYTREDDIETLVERFLFGGDDRNIKDVFVCGKRVAGWGA